MNKQNVNISPGFQKNLKLSLCILHGLRVPIAKSTRLHDHPAIPGPQKEAFWLLTKSHSSSKLYHWWHRGTSWDIYHIQTRKYVYYVQYTHMSHTYIYIYIAHTRHIYISYTHLNPFDKTNCPSSPQTHISPHSSTIFNLPPALEHDLSLRDPSMLTPQNPDFPLLPTRLPTQRWCEMNRDGSSTSTP